MSQIPFLPGSTFKELKDNFHCSHTLNLKNGYCFTDTPLKKLGNENLINNQANEKINVNDCLDLCKPQEKEQFQAFRPRFIEFTEKVLRFYGWFKQSVVESPLETFQVRKLVIHYFLLDDTISIVEPIVENSGIVQGNFVKRHKVPRMNDDSNYQFWNWKQMNVGIDFRIYARNIRLYDCDDFTKFFMEKEGILVNEKETCPTNIYLDSREKLSQLKESVRKSHKDNLKNFIELDRNVLRFFAIWDDTKTSKFGQKHDCVIHYYLVDKTIEVVEKHAPNDGRDPCSIFIHRHKIPVNRYNVSPTFPSIVLERSDREIAQYIEPSMLILGHVVKIYNRQFFLHDMDLFTRNYYTQFFRDYNVCKVEVQEKAKTGTKMEIPPYNNFGSYEDSMQSVLSIIPKPPKKNFVKIMENDIKKLRYEARMVTDNEINKGRVFIIQYHLGTDTISIIEKAQRNSGIPAGMFLEPTKIIIPGATVNAPIYYTPQDLYIGAIVDILCNKFEIYNADLYVLNYLKENSQLYGNEMIQTMELAMKNI